jgi:hypothetical protein
MRRRGGCLDGRGVRGTRDAFAARLEQRGHVLLDRCRPGVIVLAVEHEDRDAELREVLGLVRRDEQLPGHGHEAGGAVTQHPVLQEVDNVRGDTGGDGVGPAGLVPDRGHRVT